MEDDELYRDHIKEAIEQIREYISGLTFFAFAESLIVQDAVIRQFEIIGEASKHLSNEFKEKHKEIPWKQVASMRDRLVHEYFTVDVELVWETIGKDLPALLSVVT